MDASHAHQPGVKPAPFDTVLGRHGGVDVHSCDYDSVDGLDSRWKAPDAYRSELNGTICGFKVCSASSCTFRPCACCMAILIYTIDILLISHDNYVS